eukprot:CAMPEP_0170494338 /NCGR_PEP_ID=MMETSP0208-20121228/14589_1 /TAXON_ID=197538 /ORGANISM="Strombidium inclinatum, Strain S3" /LENGTH=50 /DNA_ID=CAMNT_0010770383 /DNA_START=164 /DNA_END=316 /DNA_ORIENTATION=-
MIFFQLALNWCQFIGWFGVVFGGDATGFFECMAKDTADYEWGVEVTTAPN